MKNIIILDTETFVNGFLVAGKIAGTDRRFHIWLHEEGAGRIAELLEAKATFVTFNGIRFDLPILGAAVAGHDEQTIKELADSLIVDNLAPWRAEKVYGFTTPRLDHVDLINVSPGIVGLKMYGARMHTRWLKELPLHHSARLENGDHERVLEYCYNDLDVTEQLLEALEEPLRLRVQMTRMYKVDMRSKSDTQMAETAFVTRLGLSRGEANIPPHVTYNLPHFLQFDAPQLQMLAKKISETRFRVHQHTGHVVMPEWLDSIIQIGSGTYQMGVGGLHSTHDKNVCYLADEDHAIVDIDAASFYPSIMIHCNLIPQNTGEKFIEEYKQIYYKRLEAKRTGDKAVANTLKISLNGTFGKTADRFSPLYSPDLMIAITLTGQLTLLRLIEQFVAAGFEICSANTDGIGVRYRRADEAVLRKIVDDFSALSKFEFEYTPYRVLAMKDVNNYIAITTDRKPKSKGLYAPPDLRKNPTASVCTRAVIQWLTHGTPFETTVKSGKLVEFLSARNVTGGAVQGEEYLGKTVRWYHSTAELPKITYAKNGNKVPTAEGVRALMLIENYDELPSDLDYDWYVREAIRIARDVGCGQFLSDKDNAMVPLKVKKTRRKKDES